MDNLALIFVTSFLVGMSGAVTPGPVLMVVVTETARRGFIAGPAIVLGHGLLELLTVGLLTLGASQLLRAGVVPSVVGVLGGLFLLWMAHGMLRNARHLSLRGVPTGNARGLPAGPVFAGAMASVSNPYWVVWWATVGASFIVRAAPSGAAGVGAFYAGHVLADLAWYVSVAAVVATGRRLMSDAVYRGVVVACAVFLVALGLFFMLSGFATLLGVELIPPEQT